MLDIPPQWVYILYCMQWRYMHACGDTEPSNQHRPWLKNQLGVNQLDRKSIIHDVSIELLENPACNGPWIGNGQEAGK